MLLYICVVIFIHFQNLAPFPYPTPFILIPSPYQIFEAPPHLLRLPKHIYKQRASWLIHLVRDALKNLSLLVDGNWGPWSFTTICSTTCGSGMQQRIRRCENPRAENGGNSCLVTGTTNVYRNDETDSVPCNDRACPFRGK